MAGGWAGGLRPARVPQRVVTVSLCLAEPLLPHLQNGAKEGRSEDETRCCVMVAA